MDYEEKYKTALERARIWKYKSGMPKDKQGILDDIFPELTESEDEKIKKDIIKLINNTCKGEWFIGSSKEECLAWLEKQEEKKPLYIRFGDVPSNETSKIHRGEVEIGEENGVSVYPAFITDGGNIVLGLTLPITKTTLYTQQHLLEYDNRPCYLVSGDYVGKGTDGEPLIRNISIIKRLDNYRVKEKKQGKQETLCDKYRKEHPSHSCQDITELGRCQVKESTKIQHDNKTCKENDDSLTDDEGIKEEIIDFIYDKTDTYELREKSNSWLTWLEKQGTPAKLSEEEQNRFAKGVLSSCALSFINYLEAHKYEGKMCVSNGECEDIENAFQNAMWDRLHRYYCKYIEKQGNKPQGKSALEAIKEEKVDNSNKVEPKFKHGDRVRNKKSGLEQTLGSCIKDVYEGAIPFRIKDQDDWELVAQKPAWSEEDECNLQNVDSVLFREISLSEDECMRLRDWLQSIKERATWKPTKEQIQALNEAVGIVGLLTPRGSYLKSLSEQLKRL